MSLAIIPYIYNFKYNKIEQNEKLMKIKTIDRFLKKINPVEKKKKYLVLFFCAFLDFTQKSIVFLLNNSLSNNFWIFNIIFINVFTSMITQNQLYKHQYFSIGIMILFGIGLNIVHLYQMKKKKFRL